MIVENPRDILIVETRQMKELMRLYNTDRISPGGITICYRHFSFIKVPTSISAIKAFWKEHGLTTIDFLPKPIYHRGQGHHKRWQLTNLDTDRDTLPNNSDIITFRQLLDEQCLSHSGMRYLIRLNE